MILGYAGKFLEANLSTGNIKDIKFDDDVLKDYVGGRGLAAKILWDRLGTKWETIDPLGPENILLILNWTANGIFPRRQNLRFRQVTAKQWHSRLNCWAENLALN